MIILQLTMKQKCCACAKKVGLFGIKCRCFDASGNKNIYCSICIHTKINDSDQGHSCTFDYRELGRTNSAKNNELVQCSKVDEI